MWILLAFIAVGAAIYTGFAEYSTILYDNKQDNTAGYWVGTRLMLMGLFMSGLSIMLFCRKIEALRDAEVK